MQQDISGTSGDRGEESSPSTVEQATLLDLARRAIRSVVEQLPLPEVQDSALTPFLSLPRACFVTLRRNGELRGCIGQLAAREPLWQAVINNAQGAAVRDYRFAPLQAEELKGCCIEISVLTTPRPLPFRSPEELLEQLRPGVDGVVLRIGERVGTFLPQVWEDLPEKERFMEHLARKSGCESGDWREAGVQVEVYQVRHFQETCEP